MTDLNKSYKYSRDVWDLDAFFESLEAIEKEAYKQGRQDERDWWIGKLTTDFKKALNDIIAGAVEDD